MIMQIIGVALGAISGVLLGHAITRWLDKKYTTPAKAVAHITYQMTDEQAEKIKPAIIQAISESVIDKKANYLVLGDKNDMKDIFTALLMEWYRQEEEKRSNTNGM